MEKETKNFIPDAQFDVLLRHVLLEQEKLFNEKTLDQMTQQAFAFHSAGSTPAAENTSVLQKLLEDFTPPRRKFRFNIFLLSFLAVLLAGSVYFFTKKEQVAKGVYVSFPAIVSGNSAKTPLPSINAQELASTPLPVTNPAVLPFIDSADETETNEMNKGKLPEKSGLTALHIPEDYSLAYEDIPTLSEAQKKQTEKDKQQLMRNISKKKYYGSLPPGKASVNGSLVSVDGFSIQNAEVSNLEYRTFLNDLLVQGKFDEYLLAKPVSGGWKAAGLPEFENTYFENPAYNNFPAVNMTRKGAELYCEWLTASMKTAIANKDVKWSGSKAPDFRLPSNAEWIYAARAADSTRVKYPWSRVIPDSTQNHYGCFLCNFNYTTSTAHIRTAQVCPGYAKMKNSGTHRAVITTAGMAIDTLVTAPVYSYNPNDWSQYCMVGNVSEMVWTYQVAQPGVQGEARSMGGNWNSMVDNAQIEAPEQYVGFTAASPMIGFRPMMNGYFNYSMMKQVKLHS